MGPHLVAGSNEPGLIIPASLRGAAPLPQYWRRGRLELTSELWWFRPRLPGMGAVTLWPAQLTLESRRGTVAREAFALNRSCAVLQVLHGSIPLELAVLPAHLPALWTVWPQPAQDHDIRPDQATG